MLNSSHKITKSLAKLCYFFKKNIYNARIHFIHEMYCKTKERIQAMQRIFEIRRFLNTVHLERAVNYWNWWFWQDGNGRQSEIDEFLVFSSSFPSVSLPDRYVLLLQQIAVFFFPPSPFSVCFSCPSSMFWLLFLHFLLYSLEFTILKFL